MMNKTPATINDPSRLLLNLYQEGGKTGRVADNKKIAHNNDLAGLVMSVIMQVKSWLYNLPFLKSSCYFFTTSFIRQRVLFVRKYNDMKMVAACSVVFAGAYGFRIDGIALLRNDGDGLKVETY